MIDNILCIMYGCYKGDSPLPAQLLKISLAQSHTAIIGTETCIPLSHQAQDGSLIEFCARLIKTKHAKLASLHCLTEIRIPSVPYSNV